MHESGAKKVVECRFKPPRGLLWSLSFCFCSRVLVVVEAVEEIRDDFEHGFHQTPLILR